MKMFYDVENDEFLTEKYLHDFYWEMLTDKGKAEFNNNFNDYIKCCMTYNNGVLITIEQCEQKLIKQIQNIKIDEFSIDDIVNKVLMLNDLYKFKEKNDK